MSDITESVYASGTVKAAGQYTAFPVVSGIVQTILVEPGDTVQKGTPLFLLEDNTATLNARNAQLALELSKEANLSSSGRVQEARAAVRIAREKYHLDSALYQRQQRLLAGDASTKVEVEQRRLAYISSRSNYTAARANLALLNKQLRNELQRANVTYDISKQLQNDFVVRSSISGKVYDVLKEKGELVSPQTPLAVIGQTKSFLLELRVDENDIVQVRVGQPVEISMDSYKGQVFEGVVEKIYPIMNERSRTFQVDARFVNPPATLYPNLSAEANIVLQAKKRALLLPVEYLVDGRYVLVAPDQKREVKIGLRDYRKVEILQGLDTATFVYKPQQP
ncbi:HlyD family efflux transporter periplasmic adaptor subunit [Nibribacter ruber]|uniref:HlyD family efflux transporter periplasmic adaptor subunit n=1 Tax=Nibribacter ruber TaxID=2698458 RepID=A0A6P1P574_9BACT|nr:HlyD family efflux transporter periplasmic adaptor subunit [Nibribacter ruber]